jgi:hypothetical protein
MKKALATFRNGQVQFDDAVDWPDGTRLEVAPAVTTVGQDESPWPETPEEKEAWVEWLRNLEPFDMTPEELEAFETNLKTSKEIQKELLRKSWQEEHRL